MCVLVAVGHTLTKAQLKTTTTRTGKLTHLQMAQNT